MNLTDIQKGYIAGLVDGEGYIGISISTNKFSPRLGIGMTDYEVLKWLQDLVGGCLYKRNRPYETDADTWCYVMTPNIMRKVLPVIAPLMKVKQRQAYLMCLYFSYFKQDDRDSTKGLKAKIKKQFYGLFKVMNSRGNRKQGKFKEYLSQATLSQALVEIREKVHRLESDTKDIRKEKIIATLKRDKRITRFGLAKKHYSNFKKNEKQFNEIMAELETEGIAKKVYSKYSKNGFSYIYVGNDSTKTLPEKDEIVRTAQRCVEVKDKELSR